MHFQQPRCGLVFICLEHLQHELVRIGKQCNDIQGNEYEGTADRW